MSQSGISVYLNPANSMIAKLPLILGLSYLSAFTNDATFVEPAKSMTCAQALLHVFQQGKPATELEVNILALCLSLHAEHGGENNSSFTTYVVTSTGSDIYGTITAALRSLKGPSHGAANKMVMDMMACVKEHVSDWTSDAELSQFLEQIITKKANDKSGKIYGLGHAVYTKSDPCAIVLKHPAIKQTTYFDHIMRHYYYSHPMINPN